jgi:predicted nucleic acid-binding protein
MRFIDTNIILPHLGKPITPIDQARQQASTQLFQRVRSGQEQVGTCEAVISEVLYVLCSPRQYGLTHQDAATALGPVLRLRGLRLPQKRALLRALELFATYDDLDYEDALIVAHMERRGEREFYSYDGDFDQVPTVTRLQP